MTNLAKYPPQDPIHELIAIRAYLMWENEGRPLGYHLINWYQAEQDIISCMPSDFVADKAAPYDRGA